jgi:hypothetical protein
MVSTCLCGAYRGGGRIVVIYPQQVQLTTKHAKSSADLASPVIFYIRCQKPWQERGFDLVSPLIVNSIAEDVILSFQLLFVFCGNKCLWNVGTTVNVRPVRTVYLHHEIC